VCAGVALLCAGLTACAPPGVACPAIGYFSSAQIVLSEPKSGVQLELCDGEGCVPGPPIAPVDAPLVIATELPATSGDAPAVEPDETPIEDTGVLAIAGNGLTGWNADFVGGQPVIGYRVIGADGAVIAEGAVEVEWVRVGGSAQCGGPREAKVELPA
jgi:hypothetical protein